MQGPSGARLLVEESRDLPIVRVTVTLRTGGADDPSELDGLANFATELMARGAAGRSRAALDEAFDALGTTLDIHTEYDGAHFELTVLRDRIDAAMALLADVLLRPDFPVDEADKLRREVSAQLDELRDDDGQVVRRFVARRLFGDHPYAHTLTGTEQTLPRLDVEAARGWHARALRGAGLILAFAGDVSADEARAYAERHLGALPAGDETAFGAALPDPRVRTGARLTLVDKPERNQSQIVLAQIAPGWHHPDYDALTVATHTFGGTFSSRLMDEVRSKRGLSYGANARVGQGRGRRAFTVQVYPSLAQTAETLGLVRRLIEELHRDGQPEQAIELGRRNLVESFAFQLATPEDRLDLRLSAALWGRPEDYLEAYPKRIAAVTPAAANAAVKTHLRPDDLEIVIVGTAAEVEPRLRDAGLLEHVTVETATYDRDCA